VEPTAGAFVLLALAVALGALIQGSVGFGFPLLVVPTMALIDPGYVPATVLLLSLPMAGLMAIREQHSIDVPGFCWITVGRLAGTFCGVVILATLPTDLLSALLGGFLIIAAAATFFVRDIEAISKTQLLGGIASGIMGTVGALGGTPLALVYRGRPAHELRSTLALSFVFGIVMSLFGLAATGKIGEQHVLLAIKLLPALLLGLWGSGWVARLLDGRWLRSVLSSIAAATGVTLLFKSL
jgi:uncharacterized membrane protein YfcA